MNTVTIVLLIAAFILFLLATLNVNSPRANLTAAGLACWVLAELLPLLKL